MQALQPIPLTSPLSKVEIRTLYEETFAERNDHGLWSRTGLGSDPVSPFTSEGPWEDT